MRFVVTVNGSLACKPTTHKECERIAQQYRDTFFAAIVLIEGAYEWEQWSPYAR